MQDRGNRSFSAPITLAQGAAPSDLSHEPACMRGPQSQASAMSLVRHSIGSSLMASISGGRVSGVPVGTPAPPSGMMPAHGEQNTT